MSEDTNSICLLLINNGQLQRIAACYDEEGEAINAATLLNKLATPIAGGRYSVISVDANDVETLEKYNYFEYFGSDEDDDESLIEFGEEEEEESE